MIQQTSYLLIPFQHYILHHKCSYWHVQHIRAWNVILELHPLYHSCFIYFECVISELLLVRISWCCRKLSKITLLKPSNSLCFPRIRFYVISFTKIYYTISCIVIHENPVSQNKNFTENIKYHIPVQFSSLLDRSLTGIFRTSRCSSLLDN